MQSSAGSVESRRLRRNSAFTCFLNRTPDQRRDDGRVILLGSLCAISFASTHAPANGVISCLMGPYNIRLFD